jgi:hypothetical protein
MFASIKNVVSSVKTAVASAFAKRWVKVVGITGVVVVAVGGAALLFPAAAAAVVGAIASGFKAIGAFFKGLFTKSEGDATVPAPEAGAEPVAA